jgi:hypothetical protein
MTSDEAPQSLKDFCFPKQEQKAKQNMTQCPCCKGSGFIEKEGSSVGEIRACPVSQNIDYEISTTDYPICAIPHGGKKVVLTPEDTLALIAEIRRLRGGGHRKCPCGGLGGIKKMHGKYWAECNNCECSTDTLDTPEEAWAAWDGVE